jgi:hypothetical protein
MTSPRDLIKAGALAAMAGTVPSSVAFANPVREQDKLAAGSFWPDGVRMVVSVSMQMEGGAQPARRSRKTDAEDRSEISRSAGEQVVRLRL